MQAYKTSHTCQIDCTNHDEVINSLQLKSKDLYYFWKNYQWLYNKYYGQKDQPQPQSKQPEPAHSHTQFEQEISKLSNENRKLRNENQFLKRQLQTLSANPQKSSGEMLLQKQKDRLEAKCKDYEAIREKLTQQIIILKQTIKDKEEAFEKASDNWKSELRRKDNGMIELQKNLDELRAKMMQGNTSSDQILQYQQKYRRQSQKIEMLMSNLQRKTYQILQQEFENARTELLNQFPKVITRFSQGDLSAIIVEEYQQQ